jgi:hypothetical protein
VVIATHPIKNAKDNELIPYGGGATLNEIDGNFAAWRVAGGYFALAPQGKLRGADFDPIHYRIELLSSPDIEDAEGRQVMTPVMLPVTETDVEEREDELAAQCAKLMQAMAADPSGSLTDLGAKLGLNKQTTLRRMWRLQKGRLVDNSAGRWRLTPKGAKEVAKRMT